MAFLGFSYVSNLFNDFDNVVCFRNRERITFDHLVTMKKPNETALVKVLRDGEEYEFSIILRPVSCLCFPCMYFQFIVFLFSVFIYCYSMIKPIQ